MEDGDGERGILDTTENADNVQHKDSDAEESNGEMVDAHTCLDQSNESRLGNCNLSESEETTTSSNVVSPSKIIFKGFKKRILAQTQEIHPDVVKNELQEMVPHFRSNSAPVIRNVKDKRVESKRGRITEYAQYLGLQPAAKYKCLNCHSASTFCTMSMLKQHQRACTAMTPMQGVLGSPESSSPITANFRITRKVYLCSACGTYFENWNLFLHMREVHKRHICLFCLGMFGQAERLSYHLSSKHSVPETEFQTVEDFYNTFKGSCCLICCSCEKVFSETDDFYNHFCVTPPKQSDSIVCSVCRETDSHAPTCSLVAEAKVTESSDSKSPNGSEIHGQSTNNTGKGTLKKTMRKNKLMLNDTLNTSAVRNRKLLDNENADARLQPAILDADTEINCRSEAIETDATERLSRDTVAETIMEVSKYVEGSGSDDVGDEPEPGQSSVENVSTAISEDRYDSVTETIMEVSRFHEENDQLSLEQDKDSSPDIFQVNETDETNDECEAHDAKDRDISMELDDRLNMGSPIKEKLEDEEQTMETAGAVGDDIPDISGSQASESPGTSPTSRSLFSPQRDIPAVQLNSNEEIEEAPPKTSDADEPMGAETSVSFNAVATTDRSLVIKICTNRMSKFSVTTASGVNHDAENHDTSRESEENNNGDGSTSEEKNSNVSDPGRGSPVSDHLNDAESDTDSEKLAVVDSNVEETEEPNEETQISKANDESSNPHQDNSLEPSDGIMLAGDDVPSIDLNVEGTMDSMEIETILKCCIDNASLTCVYCNHARQIAVNGKQLGLHMLAEHRFQPQHPAIIIHREQFTIRVKKCLAEVENYYFNFDSYNSNSGTYNVPETRTYECFHCRFRSTVYKELYLHNRKMHQKTILICIMCKSTFYSYSELLCHLCPGIYLPNNSVNYRCCLCPTHRLPSAFRLMVHLRKKHHACDVCLEATGNQQRLSNHVWKHKLHHLCYRCGIAYRNKPDITKHLFWKHGTESILCKKCLQKKWPHIYHFCIPPTAFVCEECGLSFSRAVALKVHKRLHSGDVPHDCKQCSSRYISRKLLLRHEESHKEPVKEIVNSSESGPRQSPIPDESVNKESTPSQDDHSVVPVDPGKEGKESVKKVVDVYDLPPLNLSSESDSDSDEDKGEPSRDTEVKSAKDNPVQVTEKGESPAIETSDGIELPRETSVDPEQNDDEKKEEAQIMDGIWNNFKSYTASLEMKESTTKIEEESDRELKLLREIIFADHDYCLPLDKEKTEEVEDGALKSETMGPEHDYTGKPPKSPTEELEGVRDEGCDNEGSKKKVKSPRKKKRSGSTSSSDSSSDSDSSSCSCGTNCSCSSSSSGSSSSSTTSSDSDSSVSEGSPRKQSNRKDRRKVKDSTRKNKSDSTEPEVPKDEPPPPPPAPPPPPPDENGPSISPIPLEVCNLPAANSIEPLLRESDLDTDETETDEDFYDEHPQQLANKLLAEKRNQLMLLAAVAPPATDSPTTQVPLNNGTLETSQDRFQNHSIASVSTPIPQSVPQIKKKIKTKKRKKSEKTKSRTHTPTVESIKLNIPKSFYENKMGFGQSSPAIITVVPSRSSTPSLSNAASELSMGKESQTNKAASRSVGSGSETDNKRSSKRKRVPKRFYGDSSEEETDRQPVLKWRKVETPSFSVVTSAPSQLQPQPIFPTDVPPYTAPTIDLSHPAVSDSESEAPAESSSDSSDSESEQQPRPTQQLQTLPEAQHHPQHPPQQYHHAQPQHPHPQHHHHQQHNFNSDGNAPVLERSDNLYCYCQCPYDEVSEMIACDGEDCRIEWFHFECVGIMVPPKGKWYCPDCLKKHGIVNATDEYFD